MFTKLNKYYQVTLFFYVHIYNGLECTFKYVTVCMYVHTWNRNCNI